MFIHEEAQDVVTDTQGSREISHSSRTDALVMDGPNVSKSILNRLN